MNLRLKLLLALIGVFSLYVAVDWSIQQHVVFPRFLALEQQEAVKDLRRCEQAIQRDIEYLDMFVHHWAACDDLHRYVTEPNAEFATENFADSMYHDTKLNLLAVVNVEHKVVFQTIRDHGFVDKIELPLFAADQWPANHPLLGHELSEAPLAQRVTQGLIMTQRGPMGVVARPILRSGNIGPVNGTLIMGRFLDAGVISSLCKQTAVEFQVTPVVKAEPEQRGSLPLNDDDSRTKKAHKSPCLIRNLSSELLAVESLLFDLTGKPILVIRADVPRSISAQGQAAIQFAIGSLLMAALAVLILMLLLLQSIVISPLTQLSEHAIRIGQTGDLTAKANLNRADEIGSLSVQFDAMVGKLCETQTRLIELSREAGMSDVATGVLHNVGNVMTNVNLINAAMGKKVKSSKLAALKKSTEMLKNHDDDLPQFLTSDQRGKQLPGFICQVSDKLEQEHLELLQQIQSMSDSLNHVGEILHAQQKFAKGTKVIEPVKLDRLVSDSIAMLSATLIRHGVMVHTQFDETPTMNIDRGNAIQILVNLLTNAKDAVKDLHVDDRFVTIATRMRNATHAEIMVTDNGCGIDPETMQKLFASGFTTKAHGHGYGLHYCVLTAKEMSGALSVHSDGLGRGATFILSLPTSTSPSEVTVSK